MNFPSPSEDFAEHKSFISSICSYEGNCRTIETPAGYAIINVVQKPRAGDSVMITFCGRMDFATVQGNALIIQDGEAIEGDSLDEVNVLGVVTFLLNRVIENDNRPVI